MSVFKNSIWNLAGFIIPTLLAIPGMAILARSLTIGEYGLFMLIFALIGYISIFDFGLNRAIIRFIAVYESDLLKKEKILGTSIAILTTISLVLLSIFYFSIDLLIELMNLKQIDYSIAYNALLMSALSIPFFLITQSFTGYLEGLQKFKLLNIQKTMTNSLLVILPVILVLVESRVDYVVFGLFLGRVINLLISILFFIKFDRINLKIDFEIVREIIFYGGWITVSNIISPIMTYFDRFVLSYYTNVTIVGFYSIATEIITRMTILPGSIAKALFPFMSSTKIQKKQYYLYMLAILLSILALVIPFLIFAEEIIEIWVGEKYLGATDKVLKILVIGLVFNAVAQVPFTYIQAIGLSKVTALVHLSELIPYLIVMSYLIIKFGIYGAAIAWVLRMIVDFMIMHIIAIKKIGNCYEK